MNGEVIKQFLVGLGFSVDDSSLSKFNKAITSATLKVTALYTSIKLTAAAVAYGISKIAEGFEQMGYEYRIIAPMINKTLVLRRELLKAYSAAGINITKVIKQSVLFNFSLAKTKFALEAIYKSVGAKFFPLLTRQMDIFRTKIYANMPKIQNALEKFVKFVFKAFEATTILGTRLWSILTRVWDFFVQLDKATDGWSTKILLAVAAWKLLNLSFLATPLGMLLLGLTSLLALYDDLQTFEEGGQSLFDWSDAIPVINALKQGLLAVKGVIEGIYEVIGNILLGIYQLTQLDFSGLKESLKGFFDIVAPPIAALFGDDKGNTAANMKNNPATTQAPPLGAQAAAGNQVNQNVRQQTNITVQGAADATAVGNVVLNGQTRVNFDMTRNLKSPTQ